MSKKISIVVLNEYRHDSRVRKTAFSLARLGYQTTVVALSGEGLSSDQLDGPVTVVRLRGAFSRWPSTTFLRLARYVGFVIGAVYQCRNQDAIHCNDLDTLPIGIFAKLFLNRRAIVVYDAHEYETESNGLRGIRKTLKKLLEKLLIGKADRVITVSEAIAGEYQRLYGGDKPSVVYNCPETERVIERDYFRERFSLGPETKIFIYLGGLGPGRGIEAVLGAFQNRQASNAAVVFMGYGSWESRIREAATKNRNIYFHEAVPPSDVLKLTACADFGISLIEDTCLSYRYCLPNKLFEYCMAGLPVLVSNLPEMSKVVVDFNVGFVVPNSSASALNEAINACLMEDKSSYAKALENFRQVFCWEEQEERLAKIYNQSLLKVPED